MPQSFVDSGLGSVVLIGDCTDLATEGCNDSVLTSAEMHSDKTKHDVAMGLAWVTPNGYVALACDLFCGRTSENEACAACAPALSKIPHKFAFMYDKGVAKLQVHLANLNQVQVPFLSLIVLPLVLLPTSALYSSPAGDHALLPQKAEAVQRGSRVPQPRSHQQPLCG